MRKGISQWLFHSNCNKTVVPAICMNIKAMAWLLGEGKATMTALLLLFFLILLITGNWLLMIRARFWCGSFNWASPVRFCNNRHRSSWGCSHNERNISRAHMHSRTCAWGRCAWAVDFVWCERALPSSCINVVWEGPLGAHLCLQVLLGQVRSQQAAAVG